MGEKLDRAGICCVSYYSATINNDQDVEGDTSDDMVRVVACAGKLAWPSCREKHNAQAA